MPPKSMDKFSGQRVAFTDTQTLSLHVCLGLKAKRSLAYHWASEDPDITWA